jgi:hypothetical protein
MRDVKLQMANLLSDYIMGFGQNTFSHLVAPLASVATGTDKEQLCSLAQSWELIMQEPFGFLPSDTKIRPVIVDGDSATEGIRIPMILLPLIGPLQFPPGIIGHTSIGTNGIKQLAGHYMADDSVASDLTWLDHPMVRRCSPPRHVFPTTWHWRSRANSQSLRASSTRMTTPPRQQSLSQTHSRSTSGA